MKQLLSYGLQVMVTSGILYGYYHFFLRNKRFHQYNRFYLLAAVLLSLVVPLLNIPVYFSEADTGSSLVLEALTTISYSGTTNAVIINAAPVQGSTWFTTETILSLLYSALVVLALFRIIMSLIRLRQIIRHNPTERVDRIRFINTDEPGTPFSFFRWLFWNREIDLHSSKGEHVFRHELFHIEQKHSLDIIFMELVTAIAWFNPFFHLVKKETKAIHEFLADQFAITENTKWQYAELLLMRAMDTKQFLVNPFFHNQIKRRIAMITHSSKPGYQYLRKLMVLPLAGIAVLLFAFNYKSIKSDPAPGKDPIVVKTGSAIVLTAADTSKPTVKPSAAIEKIYDKVQVEPAFPGGLETWRKYLEQSLDAGVAVKNKAPKGAYTVIVIFVVDGEGNISDVRTLTKHGYGMEEEAMRVIKKGPKWTPAIHNGKMVKAYRKQPVTFVVGNSRPVKDAASLTQGPLNEVVIASFDVNTIPASFPGGEKAWKDFLIKNARSSIPVDSGAPSGTYKTLIQFIVHPDGSLSDFESVTKHGFGMEQEVTRMLKDGPMWIPAIADGKKVKSYIQQPVTFVVTEDPDKTAPLQTTKRRTPSISVSEIKMANPYELLGLPKDTEILSFVFTTDLANGDISQSYNKGNQFNQATKDLIGGMVAGRLVTIDIITILENGQPKKIASRVYQVTN